MAKRTRQSRYDGSKRINLTNAGRPTDLHSQATGDCAVRAIAGALHISYGESVQRLIMKLRSQGDFKSNPLKGTPHNATTAILREEGWSLVVPQRAANRIWGYRIMFRPEYLPMGEVFVSLPKHVAYMNDRMVHDTWNSAKHGMGALLSYWIMGSEADAAAEAEEYWTRRVYEGESYTVPASLMRVAEKAIAAVTAERSPAYVSRHEAMAIGGVTRLSKKFNAAMWELGWRQAAEWDHSDGRERYRWFVPIGQPTVMVWDRPMMTSQDAGDLLAPPTLRWKRQQDGSRTTHSPSQRLDYVAWKESPGRWVVAVAGEEETILFEERTWKALQETANSILIEG